jgi:DNA-directed RNA polymerase subunit RPC12/RpoP
VEDDAEGKSRMAEKGVSYPNARKYIRGLDDLDKETKETYEFEATLCEAVIRAFGSHVCPNCGSRVFKIGEVTVDFNFPFVDGRRIRVSCLKLKPSADLEVFVECVQCGKKEPVR